MTGPCGSRFNSSRLPSMRPWRVGRGARGTPNPNPNGRRQRGGCGVRGTPTSAQRISSSSSRPRPGGRPWAGEEEKGRRAGRGSRANKGGGGTPDNESSVHACCALSYASQDYRDWASFPRWQMAAFAHKGWLKQRRQHEASKKMHGTAR
jgi:hypothetical protein